MDKTRIVASIVVCVCGAFILGLDGVLSTYVLAPTNLKASTFGIGVVLLIIGVTLLGVNIAQERHLAKILPDDKPLRNDV